MELILNCSKKQIPRRKYSCNTKSPLFSGCGREGGGRGEEEEGENRLLYTCPAPDHIQIPRCRARVREGAREKRKKREKKKGKAKGKEQRTHDSHTTNTTHNTTCTHQTTDHDLESVFAKRKVNARICAPQATDRVLEGVST